MQNKDCVSSRPGAAVKDPVLFLQWLGLLLRHRFDPHPLQWVATVVSKVEAVAQI